MLLIFDVIRKASASFRFGERYFFQVATMAKAEHPWTIIRGNRAAQQTRRERCQCPFTGRFRLCTTAVAGEARGDQPGGPSDVLPVTLSCWTEAFNRQWYEENTGRQPRHAPVSFHRLSTIVDEPASLGMHPTKLLWAGASGAMEP